MGLFNRDPAAPVTRGTLEARYNNSRWNLLLVFVLTGVNILLIFFNAGLTFVFSATVPYLIVSLMWDLTGHLPAEAYAEDPEFVPFPNAFLYAGIVIAAVILLFYLMSYLFSKDGKYGWMVAALVLFSLDCLALIAGLAAGLLATNVILDLIIHVWVMYYLIVGVSTGAKLARLPLEETDFSATAGASPSSLPREVTYQAPEMKPEEKPEEKPEDNPEEKPENPTDGEEK